MKLPPGHVAGQGVHKASGFGGFGERMLKSMGWEKGQGLGKSGDGIKEAIQVKKKDDTIGVGAGASSYKWEDKWWERAYDSAVQTLGSSDASSSDGSSDEDEEEAARIREAAGVNRDGTRTSASADELALLAHLSKGGRVAAGRFGGRDAKLARIRQQEAALAAAAAARLGVPAAAAAAGAPSGPSSGPGAVGSDRSETTSEAAVAGRGASSGGKRKRGGGGEAPASAAADGGKQQRKKGKKRRGAAGTGEQQPEPEPETGEEQQQEQEAQQQQQQQEQEQEQEAQPSKRPRIVIEPRAAAPAPAAAFVPTPAEGWWGAALFASAGCLEGLEREGAKGRERQTFDEDMQASIYNAAQAGKSRGKVGLGQGTGTVKVGGVKWEGKKVTFELDDAAAAAAAGGAAEAQPEASEEEGGGGEGGAAAAAPPRRRLAAVGSSTRLDQLGRRGSAPQQEQLQQQGWDGRVKWRKIISAQLAAAPEGSMRLRELQRRVVAAVLAKHGALAPGKAGVKAAFLERLRASSRFVVEGGLVRLAA